eukprot:scpid85311/ scgid22979/ 
MTYSDYTCRNHGRCLAVASIAFIIQLCVVSGQLTESPMSTAGRVGECPTELSVFSLALMNCNSDLECTNQLCCLQPNTQQRFCVDAVITNPSGNSGCVHEGVARANLDTWQSSAMTGNAACSCDNGAVRCVKPGECSTGFQEPSGSGQCVSCALGRDDQCTSTSKCCPTMNSCIGVSACFTSTALQCATNDNQQSMIAGGAVSRSDHSGLPATCQDCICNGSSGSFVRSGGCPDVCVPNVCYVELNSSVTTVMQNNPQTLTNATASYQCACIAGRLQCKRGAGNGGDGGDGD